MHVIYKVEVAKRGATVCLSLLLCPIGKYHCSSKETGSLSYRQHLCYMVSGSAHYSQVSMIRLVVGSKTTEQSVLPGYASDFFLSFVSI